MAFIRSVKRVVGTVPWKKVGNWAWKNRGAVASGAATIGCLVPAAGWATCAGMQAFAYGVRAKQRADEGGGWRRTWRANAADGVSSAVGFMGTAAMRNAALGGWSRWRETRRGVPFFHPGSWIHQKRAGWKSEPAPVFVGYTVASIVPAVLNFVFKPFSF